MANILIIEDDDSIRNNVKEMLELEGNRVECAANGKMGLDMLSGETDMILLDVMLPEMDGIEVCEKVRERSNVPILFLTAKTQEKDKILGLTVGGDDYIVKPFSYAELKARMKAILRRRIVYDAGRSDESTEEDWIIRGKVHIHTHEHFHRAVSLT